MKAYWDSLTKEQQGELAGKVGSTPGYLRLVFNGYKKASFVLAKKLEQCTSGAITKSDLRPDKGEVSTACRGCKGKGIVLDEKRTRLHGTPVYKICGRCNGNRFSRLPTTLARHHVQKLVPDLTDYQWYKGYADVIDKLVTKCWQEEAYAEAQLRRVTR